MTLELEKLTPDIDKMVRSAQQRQARRAEEVATARAKMARYATSWATIDERLARALDQADRKFFRAARPFAGDPAPLDAAIPAAVPPVEATIFAADGSQILPSRHAPFLYYLIHVGGIIYHHGQGRSPETFTQAAINYPQEPELAAAVDEAAETDNFALAGGIVNVRRDLAEIETLAQSVAGYAGGTSPAAGGPPRLALVDQRLLYWPIGAESEGPMAVGRWREAMTRIRQSGGWLAGYIDRPGKSAVANLLHVLDIDEPGFDLNAVSRRHPWERLQDIDLFAGLAPGQRSKLFVDVSLHNEAFKADNPDNEICFFYLHAGGGNLARVDIPMWVARDATAVAHVHALIYDQCTILGGYPYVLTRADEIAVVGRQDQAALDARIAWFMEQRAVDFAGTAKQQSKDIARVQNKTRHAL